MPGPLLNPNQTQAAPLNTGPIGGLLKATSGALTIATVTLVAAPGPGLCLRVFSLAVPGIAGGQHVGLIDATAGIEFVTLAGGASHPYEYVGGTLCSVNGILQVISSAASGAANVAYDIVSQPLIS